MILHIDSTEFFPRDGACFGFAYTVLLKTRLSVGAYLKMYRVRNIRKNANKILETLYLNQLRSKLYIIL